MDLPGLVHVTINYHTVATSKYKRKLYLAFIIVRFAHGNIDVFLYLNEVLVKNKLVYGVIVG